MSIFVEYVQSTSKGLGTDVGSYSFVAGNICSLSRTFLERFASSDETLPSFTPSLLSFFGYLKNVMCRDIDQNNDVLVVCNCRFASPKMEDINEELNPCEVCEAKASQRCSGCQSVFYCSRDHQRQDWKTHRLTCRAYRIESNPIVGRHLVACRDLKPGQISL